MTKANKFIDSFDKQQSDILRYANDPVAFTRDILGLKCEWFHREWLKSFEENRFNVLLAPRGHGKTSIVGAYILWRIIRDRRMRSIIVTINQDKANSMMTFVQKNLSNNPKLIELFGEFRGSLWSRDSIRVKQIDNSKIPHNEPTLKVIGVGSKIISGHYGLIVLDDITDEESNHTEKRRRDIESWYNKEIVGTFLSKTRVINIGTRWHEDDIHNYFMNKFGYTTLRYESVLNLEKADNGEEEHKVLWPEHLPWDDKMRDEINSDLTNKGLLDEILLDDCLTLKFIREHQGELAFQMQYQNNIIPASIAKFKQEWLDASVDKYRKLAGSGPIGMRKFMGVDIGGEDTISDWCVFTVIGIDSDGIIYTLEQIRTHASLNRQVNIIKGLDEIWHVSKIGIDSSAQQKLITSEWIKDNPNLPIIPIKLSRVNDRETRTDRLSILFETNRICLDPKYTHLLDELRMYPRGKHDDCIDALSFALETSQGTAFINWAKAPNSIITKRDYSLRTV